MLNSIITHCISLCICLLLFTSPLFAAPNTSLIQNGDFSQGLTHWTQSGGQVLSTQNVFTVNVPNPGNPWDVNLSYPLPTEDNITYVLTFKAKSNIIRTLKAGLGMAHNPWQADNVQEYTITQQWQEYIWVYTTGYGNDNNSRIIFDMGQEAGEVSIIDVDLIVLPEVSSSSVLSSSSSLPSSSSQVISSSTISSSSTVSLIENGDFSQGLTHWTQSGGQVLSTQDVFTVNVPNRGNPWDVNLSYPLPTEDETVYVLTFRAKSNTNRTLKAGLGMTHNPWQADNVETYDLTNQWQEFIWTYPTGYGYNDNSRIIFDMGQEAGEVSINDVELIVFPEVSSSSVVSSSSSLPSSSSMVISSSAILSSAATSSSSVAISSSTPISSFQSSSSSVPISSSTISSSSLALSSSTISSSSIVSLIENGNFSQSLTHWTQSGGQVLSTQDVFTVNVPTNGNPWDVNLSYPLSTEDETVYVLTFKAKSNVDRSIKAGLGMAHNPWQAGNVEDYALTNQWQDFIWVYPTGYGYDDNSRIIFDMGHEVGEVSIDDVELIVLPQVSSSSTMSSSSQISSSESSSSSVSSSSSSIPGSLATDIYAYADGYQLKIEEQIEGNWTAPRDYIVKGVCWNPTPFGVMNNPDFAGSVAADAPLMAAAHINTVRTYFPLPLTSASLTVLDVLHEHGIKVIMTVYANYAEPELYVQTVNYFKDHPAVLMWLVGNEINYNRLYTAYVGTPISMDETINKANAVAASIKAADSSRPTSISWGYWHGNGENHVYMRRLDQADVFAVNSYVALSWYINGLDLFVDYAASINTPTPMFLAEYGADSYHMWAGSEDEAAQAQAVTANTEGIRDNLSAHGAGAATSIGGTIFEWNDEWWKTFEHTRSPIDVQDNGGFNPPGDAPYPDGFFNEEYFGIVSLFRVPKQAYYALQSVYATY